VLDTVHGADYFRRWHRNKQNSGGLMVHKATHHFDLVNWWLSSVPVSVFAMGHRKFYTPQQALRYGLNHRGERCLECAERTKCPFVLKSVEDTYRLNEEYDGYIRDRCVFSDQIDIEDSMNLVVAYASGAKMSYSLNAFLPWEGYLVSYNGTMGRIEFKCEEQVWLSESEAVGGEHYRDEVAPEGTTIRIFPHFRAGYSVEPWTGSGGHSGGDDVMAQDIFSPCPPHDKYQRAADQRAGAYSILTGIAANQSMSTGQLVYIDELVRGIGMPDFAPMPSPLDPIDLGSVRARRTDGEVAPGRFRQRP
jgi:predicted dehydrogenase